ncbi:hypothetical protein [Phenylobacterium sp.]|uniref:hypothetical protein n=1 Tax=Phenylobacterium sp. TaxID=1871053 RepID=UPI0035666B53
MPQDPEPKAESRASWWQTLPGMVTAVAALLTAIGGLILALSQAGLLHRSAAAASAEAPGVPQAQTPQVPPPQAQAAPAAGAPAVSFAPGAQVTLGNNRGRGTYELLSAGVERRTAEAGTLTLKVRLTNAGPNDIGFWNDSFRLAVDGVPRAPTSWLNSSVDPRSAKEADLVFALPLTAKTLSLRINSGDEDGEIPLTLK